VNALNNNEYHGGGNTRLAAVGSKIDNGTNQRHQQCGQETRNDCNIGNQTSGQKSIDFSFAIGFIALALFIKTTSGLGC
jgi:hypothetical protein